VTRPWQNCKKNDDLIVEEEQQMLACEAAKLECPTGVNNRFTYYCTTIFFIRDSKEMQDTNESMFSLLTNGDDQVFLRYALVSCFVTIVEFLCLILGLIVVELFACFP